MEAAGGMGEVLKLGEQPARPGFFARARLPLYITGWYGLTLFSSIYAKLFFKLGGSTIVLTTCSFFVAAVGRILFKRESLFNKRELLPVAFLHFASVYLTNASLSSAEVWFTYSIKALEPVTTAFLAYLITNKKPSSVLEVAQLLLLGLGVLLATVKENTSMRATMLSHGCITALLSNLACSTRSVLSKKIMTSRSSTSTPAELSISFFLEMSTLAFLMALPSCLWSIVSTMGRDLTSTQLAVSSATHAGYYILSYLVLGLLDPTSHAVANAMKRVVATVVPALFFGSILHPLNWAGVVISNVATYVYAEGKRRKALSSEAKLWDSRPRSSVRTALVAGTCVAGIFICFGVATIAWLYTSSEDFRGFRPARHHLSRTADHRFLPGHSCSLTIRNALISALKPYVEPAKKILYLGEPGHMNLGDSFIWAGSMRVLTYLGHEPEYYYNTSSPPRRVFQDFNVTRALLKLNYGADNREKKAWTGVAFLQGGGNWGSTWRGEHIGRPSTINILLKNNVTVIMGPQSPFYQQDESPNNAMFRKDKEEISEGLDADSLKHFILCHRWLHSYTFFQKEFPEITNLLTPDGAFGMGPIMPAPIEDSHRKKLLFIIRPDHESPLGTQGETSRHIAARLKAAGLGRKDFRVADWYSQNVFARPGRNVANRAEARTSIGARFVASSDVVVTDRLHASIMSLLVGVPHVYMDTVQRKISGAREVSLRGEECQPDRIQGYKVATLDEAIDKALSILAKMQKA